MTLAAKNIIQKNKGYYLLSSLTAISLIVLILSPKNGFAWGIFGLFVARTFTMRFRPLWLSTLIILIITGTLTVLNEVTNRTILTPAIKSGIIRIDPNEYKVNGNSLSGTGWLLDEPVAFYHQMQSEEEKEYWLDLTIPVHVQAHFILEEPESATNRFQFDYQEYLYRKSIHWTVEIEKISSITADTTFNGYFSKFRTELLGYLKKGLPDDKTADYIMAMLFNQTDDIERLAMTAYRKIGILHIFSISGMHIHFLISALEYGLLRIGITRETTRPLLLVTVLCYGFLTGGGIGVFRALFTHAVLLVSGMLGEEVDVKDAFAFAILFALWQNPYLVFSIAFQLSYTLSGLLYFLSPRFKGMKRHAFIKDLLLSVMMTTVSGLFLSYHYFEITWIGMFVNILFSFFFSSLLFPVFWLLAMLSLLRFPVSVVSLLTQKVAFLLEYLEKCSQWLADANWLLMITGRPGLIWYLLLGIIIIIFLTAFEQRKYQYTMTLILIGGFTGFYLLPLINSEGRVIMLDVGQGDAILIKMPYREQTVLIDTGGVVSFNSEEATWKIRESSDKHGRDLVSAIKAEGVTHLDAVLLTHSDSDHIGNLGYLANEIKINKLFIASGMEETATFQAEMKEIRKLPTIVPLISNKTFRMDSLIFQVLNPETKRAGENNDSLVLYSRIGGLNWLFTGDLEEKGERELMKRYPAIKVDILKVGHHGSITSTSESFLKQINPEVAFISVGRNNRYGHPTTEVIKRLDENATRIYRTDLNGAVHYIFKGQEKWIDIMLQ
ncbi:DNA internalization-related competence protein ComEC/Rec2 [Jeotgalibaca sp. A127]|uniref:DNA internalization-related competence protein ComEC/Rec2 n=1 Tax=Jeotgalibaca sp. A127 TaxID=3457324 RepID=UPI003FCFCAAC